MNDTYILIAIAITSFLTILLRFTPFLIFKEKLPSVLEYLGKVLPEAIMAMLVIYCLKDVTLFQGNHGIPEIIALIVVYIVHKLKHHTLYSILSGTITYMILIQMIF